MSKIVVFGSCSIDYVTYARKLPKPGETVHGYKFKTAYGGKGANQCVAAAKLRADTSMVARVGNDVQGREYIEYMTALGIDTAHMSTTEGKQTGIAQVTVEDGGENQIVIVKGANEALSVEDVDRAKDIIGRSSVLVCQLETPVESAVAAFKLCKGIKILNAAPAVKDLNEELLSLTTILCVNESEASAMTGRSIESKSDIIETTEDLLKLGCETVIVTLGPDGAAFVTKEKRVASFVPCRKVRAVDATGAGDAFVGALAAALALRGEISIESAIASAARAASASVVREGTHDSFATAFDGSA